MIELTEVQEILRKHARDTLAAALPPTEKEMEEWDRLLRETPLPTLIHQRSLSNKLIALGEGFTPPPFHMETSTTAICPFCKTEVDIVFSSDGAVGADECCDKFMLFMEGKQK